MYDYSVGFIAHSPDVLVHLNEDFSVIFVNKAFENIFGIDREEALGLDWKSLPGVRGDQIAVENEELSARLEPGGESYDFILWPDDLTDDSRYGLHARLYAEKTTDSQLSYWITARKIETTSAFAKNNKAVEKNYLRLVENLPDLVCRYSPDLKIVYANEACRYHFGLEPSEMVNKTKEDMGVLDKTALDLWKTHLTRTFKKEEAGEFSFIIEDTDKPRHFHTTIVPEKGGSGTVDYALAITREVTTQKQVEDKLKKDNEDLRSLNTYLDNFIYTIAHDLRGPVGNLKSLLWLYKLEKEDGARKDIMEKLEGTFDRLDNRLKGLIGLIESMANLESKIATCKLENIIRDIQADLENRPDFTPYTIHKHLDVKNIKYIEAYMVSILSNLLSNIMKYKDPDRPLRIRVSTYRMGKFVILEVEDNGIGIDLDRVGKNLFKPFRRFTKQSEGKGIGLHIIKTMVEKNGGRIEVQSQVGEGTTFQLYLKEY
ncbi:MAG: PAS domain-containing sensor histidine kinase [Cyclobacteriaceae bacterium]